MNASNQNNPKRSGLQSIFITIIVFLVLAVVVVLLLLSADMQFSILDQLFNRETGVEISGTPAGCDVSIDEEFAGRTPINLRIQLESIVRIECKGYRPYELIMDQVNLRRIEYSLVKIPVLEEVDSQVSNFVIRPNGDLIYFKQNLFFRWDAQEKKSIQQSEIMIVPSMVSFSPQTDEILLASVGTYLRELDYMADLTADLVEVKDPFVDFAWGPGSNQYSVLSEGETQGLLEIYQGETAATRIDFNLLDGLESIAWCQSGDRFVIQWQGMFSIYSFDNDQLREMVSAKPGYYAKCSPVDSGQIVYLDNQQNLFRYEIEDKHTGLIAVHVAVPYIWHPDGGSILFSRFNPDQGQSSIWQVDPNSKNLTLLVDTSLVWGKIADFQITADQKYLAYLTETDHLFLITLSD